MKLFRAAFALVGFCLATFPATADEAVPPSRFGPDDTLGAVNLLTDKHVTRAARLVKTGKTYSLGMVTGRKTPAYPPRSFDIVVLQPGDGKGLPLGSNRMTGNDDLLRTWVGIGSQLDGLGHIGIDHVYYNQLKAEDFVVPTGLAKLGTHLVPPIVTRGVLLDMTAVFNKAMLNEGEVFNTAEIDAAMKRQRVRIGEGDVVLFHTGWHALLGKDDARFGTAEPGLGKAGAQYLASLGVVAVGADTWGVEAVPFEDSSEVFPVHQILLAKNGVYLLENMVTAELQADSAWEFMFVLGQPRFEGSVQAVINPIAIR